ncbi:ABC transporter ATP-binding protein [Candidatus Venteria ishoeyi]|uniref:Putative ABC transporter ATP-binding protein YxlF n=1 Tax=Candidatus Venteria ishoeyi TaxID=1899563 RepID=A0A1H6FIG5_9GAMM|nr:ATP-binding cassette domain-containing protein [Candidatus Venteria ishoeyi]SEH09169.1 putative ABC transporter ATP-binding protein YxlF [Candidatus Venteria ishoeyi]SEH09298.1 putative ABC transporter ATP-binding protein YxlF [Candidatus Venteria ishoeyi]
MMKNTPLLAVDSLSHYYRQHCALNPLSFQLQAGEVMGFLGPNGAGKSTTLQILAGVLSPHSGSVRIQGHDLFSQPKAARRCLGYLPDQPPLYPEMRVNAYLQFCAQLHELPRSRQKHAVKEVVSACGLEEKSHQLIATLSKGYQQRLGLAQAIIHQPPLILLDEPTIGLDPEQLQAVRQLIRQFGKHSGIILSSHILSEVEAVCDRVLILHQGTMRFDDTLSHLQQQIQGQQLILGLNQPPELKLLSAIPGIKKVTQQDALHWRVYCHDENQDLKALASKLADCAAQQQWGLFELRQERSSLEQAFLETIKHS